MKEFIQKTDDELLKLLAEKREALRSFQINLSGSKTRNVKEGLAVRKDIARIQTLQNSRCLEKA